MIFAIIMTLLSGILFKELLNLPIPFDPAGLIPGPINAAYAGFKSSIAHAIAGQYQLVLVFDETRTAFQSRAQQGDQAEAAGNNDTDTDSGIDDATQLRAEVMAERSER